MRSPEEARTQLETAILGAPPALSSADVAAVAGFTDTQTGRFWRALGFARGDDESNPYTAADARALSTVGQVIESGLLDEETVILMTRAVGQTMSRLADWEVATLADRVETLEAGELATGSRLNHAFRMVEEVQPVFEELLIYAWRRHLAAAVLRVEAIGSSDHDLHNAEYTIGFADLVGFSAFSNRHTQDEVGELVEKFEDRAFDRIAAHGGRAIKTLGDSVLFVAESPVEAYDIAAAIVEMVGHDESIPDVRLGLATGPVDLRRGDVFGPAVNLASRMTTVARRNRIICDLRTAELLPEDEFETRRLPLRPIRGFGDIEPVAVRRRHA